MNYTVQQDKLKLQNLESNILEYLCKRANSLKNSANWYLRKASVISNKVESNYFDLCKLFSGLSDHNYKILHSQVAQQALGEVCESFKSYDSLLKLWYKGNLKGRPEFPHYRKSGGLSGITYPKQTLNFSNLLVNGTFTLPLGRTFKEEFGIGELTLSMPSNFDLDKINSIVEIRIIPRAMNFYVEYVCKEPEHKLELNSQNALGIDPGVKNWLTCVSNLGDSFIIDGKKANFWNNSANRGIAKAKSGKPQGFWSKKLALTYEKRNRRFRDYINKICRRIVNYCIVNDIGTVVFGWNKGVKTGVNMGKRNNQTFSQLPTAKLKSRLQELCEEHGINFVETEESYTSKASFLDNDSLPKFGEKPESWKPSGRRAPKGIHKLYKTASGWLINADCNGAANILRKVAIGLNISLDNINRGVVTSPYRIDLEKLNSREFNLGFIAV